MKTVTFSSQEEMDQWMARQQQLAANQIVHMVEVDGVWKKPLALPAQEVAL